MNSKVRPHLLSHLLTIPHRALLVPLALAPPLPHASPSRPTNMSVQQTCISTQLLPLLVFFLDDFQKQL